MNKLFGIVFVLTFLIASGDYWGYAWFGILALLLIAPYTTPENIGKGKE
jgi:hypothetical protein